MNTFLNKLKRENKLQLVEPSNEISSSYQRKADNCLKSAKILARENLNENSITEAYYSMYNISLSLFFKCGIKCENHSAAILLLKDIFSLTKLSNDLAEAKKERIDKQYYTDFRITKKEVEQGILNAEKFNGDLKAFISELKKSDIDIYRNKFEELKKW